MAERELLTQDEIDALLRGVDSGAVPTQAPAAITGEIRLWDPTEGDRVVRSTLPSLDAIHERFARGAREALLEVLPRIGDVALRGTEIRRFGEFAATLGVPAGIAILRAKQPSGSALLILDSRLVFALVDSFFGGDGKLPKGVPEREFTRAELRVVERLVRRMLDALRASWQPVYPLEFDLIGFEARPAFITAFTGHDEALVSRLSVAVDDAEATIHIALAPTIVDPLRPRLSAECTDDAAAARQRFIDTLRERVRDVAVEVSGVLAETRVSLRKLSSLKAGDILPLDAPRLTTIYAEQLPVFCGTFGVANGHQAVKVAALLEDGQAPSLSLH